MISADSYINKYSLPMEYLEWLFTNKVSFKEETKENTIFYQKDLTDLNKEELIELRQFFNDNYKEYDEKRKLKRYNEQTKAFAKLVPEDSSFIELGEDNNKKQLKI